MSMQSILQGILTRLKRHDKAIEENKRLLTNAPLNAGKASLLTIVSGAISVTRPHVLLLPESGIADNLDTINNGADGKFVLLSAAEAGDTITVRDYGISAGNIALRDVDSVVLADPEDTLLLVYKDSEGRWLQIDGGGAPVAHAPSHQHGGGDEVATATPAANAIPKAGADNKLDAGWIPAGVAPGAHASTHADGGSDELLHSALDGAGTNTHAQIDSHLGNTSNPHSVTKAQVGLSNVTNDAQIPLVQKGAVNGVAELDASGRVPTAQMPVTVMEYKGTWDASTNTPTLADGVGSTGDTYRVSVAGSQNLGSGAISFSVGDYVIYNGSTWEKSDTTDAVSSVNGATGVVVLTTTNVNEGSNLYFTDERAQDALGAILTDGNGIDVTYTDEPAPSIVFDLTTLTSNWDIGEDRRILAEGFRARDSEGLRIEDESGALGVFVLSGGKVAIGSATVATDAVLEVERNQNSVTGIRVENTDTTNTSSRATFDAVSGTVLHRNIAITGYGALIGTGSNDKLELMTNGDTRLWMLATGEASFGVLAVANQAQLNVAQILTQGNALRVYRNLTATSTDSPLVSFIQDHASDDQVLLRLQQDGSGKIISAFDGAVEVFSILDGGNIQTSSGTKLGLGIAPSAVITLSAAITTAYAGIVPNITDSVSAFSNVVAAEADNLMSFFQFSVNGGTHNRVGGIGFIAESAANRKGSLVFVTDSGSGNRTEKVRITGDGLVGIGDTPTAQLHVNQLATTGEALRVIRNLSAANTNSPLINFIQDAATDDQPLLRLQQDGSGKIITVFDGATEVFSILDGGNTGVGTGAPGAKFEVAELTDADLFQFLRARGGNEKKAALLLLTNTSAGGAAGAAIYHDGTALTLSDTTGFADPHLVIDGGKVGIGALPVTMMFEVVKNAAGNDPRIRLINTNDNANYSGFEFFDTSVKGGWYWLRSTDELSIWVGASQLIYMPATYLGFGIGGTPSAQLQVTQVTTTGEALRVIRNLAAASTNSPLVNLIQDAATDDQDALRVQQDGSGKLFTFLDGATERWAMADGGAATLTGTLDVTGAVDLDSTLNVDGATTLNTATVKPGTAADTAKVGGMVYNQALTAGNAAAAQSDILTISIPANILSADNMALCWEAFGVWRNGATVAEVRFLFGATQLVTMPISGATGQAWMARGTIHRTGAATQRAVSHGIPGLGSTTFILQSVTPAETLSGAVNFIVRGFSAGPTANDVVIHSLKIWWEDANT